MEIELEPRVKPLPYKVKGMSRESPSQKAAFVLDTDLRTHWSTATNTKEWILLELDVTLSLSLYTLIYVCLIAIVICACDDGLRKKITNFRILILFHLIIFNKLGKF